MKTKRTTQKRLELIFLFLFLFSVYSGHAKIHYYSNLGDLLKFVGHICKTPTDNLLYFPTPVDPNDEVHPGDIIMFNGTDPINLDELSTYAVGCTIGTPSLPLIVPAGATLAGNYDLLSESFDYTDPLTQTISTFQTNPNGVLFYSNTFRSQYSDLSVPNTLSRHTDFFFTMMPGSFNIPGDFETTIRNVRIQGPSLNWTEFNTGNGVGQDKLYCGGIKVWKPCKFSDPIANCDPPASNSLEGYGYKISHCEIFGFSTAGIWFEDHTSGISIDHCYIHHIKGISYEGIGYGIWIRGRVEVIGSDPNITLSNNVFDECKDAFDADASFYNIEFKKNTLLNFAGGINRHNSQGPCDYFLHSANTSGYRFFHRNDEGTGPNGTPPFQCSNIKECLGQNPFEIEDLTQGNCWFQNNLFYKEGISTNYPADVFGNGGVSPYILNVTQNTFTQDHDLPNDEYDCGPNNDGENHKHGYAQVADNYLENKIWGDEPFFNYSNNSFNYKQNTLVAPGGAPQPPEIWLDLLDQTGTSLLPLTTTSSKNQQHKFTQYIKAGESFVLRAKQGGLGCTNSSFLIRYNSSLQGSLGNNNSGNNYYYHDQYLIPASNTHYTAPPLTITEPGLYGIDAIAIANNSQNGSWDKYQTSKWQHIPLIVGLNPTGTIKKVLSFNIKDSYQEFHNVIANMGGLTGVYKQVEINGHPIWQEDIALGGDGWERVQINLEDVDPLTSTPFFEHIKIDGSKNILSFSIVIPPGTIPVSTEIVKGVLVWVDDVYINKNNLIDNLVKNGGFENSDKLNTSGWYEMNPATINCSSLVRIFNPFEDKDVYQDGYPLVFGTQGASVLTQTSLSTIDRKSGSQSIILKLPGIKFSDCNTYPVANPNGILISAATDLDYTDFFNCSEYTFDIINPDPERDYFEFPQNGGQLVEGARYYLDKDVVLTTDLIMKNNIIAVHPNKSILVNDGFQVIVEEAGSTGVNTTMFGCEDMWLGFDIKAGGDIELKGNPNKKIQISDAETAIKSEGVSGGSPEYFMIQSVLFDQNYTALHLSGTFKDPNSNTPQTYINGCDFTCSSSVITKAPNYGKIPPQHIKLSEVTGLSNINSPPLIIGNTSAAFKNKFSGAYFGLLSINSNVELHYSDFFMPDISDEKSAFYGVYGTDQNPTHPTGMHLVSNADNSANSFSNLSSAVFTNYLRNVSANACIVDNCINGIIIKKGFQIEVNDNIISNFKIGIGIYDSESSRDISFINYVLRNNLNVGLPLADLKRFGSTGIDIQNALSPNIPVTLTSNNIYNAEIGIHARNSDNVTIGKTSTDFNTIVDNSLPPDFGGNFTTHFGIWVENSNSASINNNLVQWTGGTVNDPAYLRSHSGIGISRSLSCTVNGNTIINYGGGFKIFDDCSQTELRCNTMDHCYHGVYFDVNGMNNQISPNQGVYTGVQASNVSWNNRWLNTISGVNKVDGSVPPNFTIRWVYDVNSTIEFDPDPSAGFVDRKQGISHIICP